MTDKKAVEAEDSQVRKYLGYILVDLDRTLATYTEFELQGKMIGEPIAPMVERVRRWTEDGVEVRIFTARAAKDNPNRRQDMEAIDLWLREHIGDSFTITNEKDFRCMAIWDDLAVTVEPNTGACLVAANIDPLSEEEEMKLLAAGYLESEKLAELEEKTVTNTETTEASPAARDYSEC